MIQFDLQSGFAAAADTVYWLRLAGAGGASPWWVTSSATGNAYNGSGNSGASLAFYLNADGTSTSVPEPGSLALAGLGLAALGLRRRFKPV